MEPKTNYNINLDVKYKHLELIDVPEVVKGCKEKWYNQTLTKINNSVVRLGIIEGEFHWHKHDKDDEFFFVLSGKLYIDLQDRTIELEKEQGVTISRGVMHRPRAPEKVVMLMVETCGIEPLGDNAVGISPSTSIAQFYLIEGLSVRSINVCHSVNVKTLGELLDFYNDKRNNFSLIRNSGVKTNKELTNLCEKYKNLNSHKDATLPAP